jgi:hypothetical protein
LASKTSTDPQTHAPLEIGPLTPEQAIADTLRLEREGFIVVMVAGNGRRSAWNFLFETLEDSIFFRKSIDEVMFLTEGDGIAEDVLEEIALSYTTVRYTFQYSDGQRRRARDSAA